MREKIVALQKTKEMALKVALGTLPLLQKVRLAGVGLRNKSVSPMSRMPEVRPAQEFLRYLR